jgi:type IV secretion system protein VirD4
MLLAPFRFARHLIGVVLFAIVLFAALFLLLLLSIWFSSWIERRGPQLGFIGIGGAVVLVTV